MRRVRQVPSRSATASPGPYRASEFPLERVPDELHVEVARDPTTLTMIAFAALVVAMMVHGAAPAVAIGLVAVAAWMGAAAAFGRLRFRFRPGLLEQRATRVWTPLWRPALTGTLTSMRVEVRGYVEKPRRTRRYTVVAETTHGTLALCASTVAAEAYAFTEVVDRNFGVTPPSALPDPVVPDPR